MRQAMRTDAVRGGQIGADRRRSPLARLRAWLPGCGQACGAASRAATIIALGLAAFAQPIEAGAQTQATVAAMNLPQVGAYARLRASVTVDEPIVTLGDLVSGAGSAASTPVFMAPEPGLVGRLDASLVRDAALKAGLSGLDTAGLDGISVHRFGTLAGGAEIEALLRDELAMRLGAPSGEALRLVLTEPLRDMSLAAEARVEVTSLDVSADRFEGRIALGGRSQAVRGRVAVLVPALVLTRPIGRGEVLEASDLTFAEIVRPQHGEAVPAYEEALGFAVARGLKAGEPVLAGDLTRPIVVTRGQPITLVHRTGRMTLTARGDALKDGRIGDVIDVLNTQSRRIVQARVLGAQEAEALGGAPRPARMSMR